MKTMQDYIVDFAASIYVHTYAYPIAFCITPLTTKCIRE